MRTSSTPSKTEHSGADSVAILQDTLAWGHVCPTSPGEYCARVLSGVRGVCALLFSQLRLFFAWVFGSQS